MVEAYGGGSNEADFTAFQQFLVAAGAGTYMNAKKLSFLLLILVAVACTNRSTSSEQDEVRHWNNVLQQINALLLENKAQQTLDLAKQTLPEILESAEKNGTTDTLIYYARKIFNACGNNYINTKQYKDDID